MTNPSYSYDANGNMTGGGGRSITPTSFNMAASVVQGAEADCFTYDSEHNRTEMDVRATSCSGTLGSSTIYLNDIVDIPIPQGMPGAGGVTQIAHIPFDKAALAASVDRLLATCVSPASSFESGYKQWQDAKGGIFTISVEKAIEIMFQTINQNRTLNQGRG